MPVYAAVAPNTESGMQRAAVEAMARALTVWVSIVLLALWLAASAVAAAGGRAWPESARALDPAGAGSIADMWALLQLAAAAAVSWRWGRCGLATAVPLVLLAADGGDLSARFAVMAPAQPQLAKLLANLALGGAALAPALALWRGSCSRARRLGRRLAAPLLIGGISSVALDTAGAALQGELQHWAVASEEGIELLVYAALASTLIADGLERKLVGPISSPFGTITRLVLPLKLFRKLDGLS